MEFVVWPSVSVIIVGHNSRSDLATCLPSVTEQEYDGAREIIFVDNASLDGSSKYVREQFPEVRVIEVGFNAGYSGGNNRGAHAAIGDILVFLNPDTEAHPGWLRELVRPLTEDAGTGLTTSTIVLMNQPDLINTCGNNVALSGITTCRRTRQQYQDVNANEEVAAVSGASFAIRADLFRRQNGFDEAFFMYVEDTDLSWRARLLGYHCLLAARSIVAHRYQQQIPAQKLYYLERNRYQMLIKNLEARSLLALMPVLWLGELVAWGWALCRGHQHIRAKLAAILWIIQNVRSILDRRRRIQRSRSSSDRIILKQHHVVPPMERVVGGALGRIGGSLIAPVAVAAAIPLLVMLRLLPIPIAVVTVMTDGIARAQLLWWGY